MLLEVNNDYFDEEEMTNTPKRWRKIWTEFNRNQEFKFTTFKNKGYNQMVILKDIDFYSFCAHHCLPFYGKVHIGYIPDKKICGISKLARAVDKFASKPQLQERLTQDIADMIEKELKPKGVMVIVDGIHLCMRMRGIKKQNATMITSSVKGIFMSKAVRNEFLRLVKG